VYVTFTGIPKLTNRPISKYKFARMDISMHDLGIVIVSQKLFYKIIVFSVIKYKGRTSLQNLPDSHHDNHVNSYKFIMYFTIQQMPYRFRFNVEDSEQGLYHKRSEVQPKEGPLKGSYSYLRSDGVYMTVE